MAEICLHVHYLDLIEESYVQQLNMNKYLLKGLVRECDLTSVHSVVLDSARAGIHCFFRPSAQAEDVPMETVRLWNIGRWMRDQQVHFSWVRHAFKSPAELLEEGRQSYWLERPVDKRISVRNR